MLFKGETELSKMFGSMFENQITHTTSALIKDYISQHLKYRSDLDYFQWQVKDESYT